MTVVRSGWFGVLAHVPLGLIILGVVQSDGTGLEIFVPFIVAWALGVILTVLIYWDARRGGTTDLNVLGTSFWGVLYPPYYWWGYARSSPTTWSTPAN